MRTLLSILTVTLWLAGAPPANGAAPVHPILPAAEWLVSNVVVRADVAAKATAAQPYRYTRETVFEELDARGDVKSTQSKTYEVTLISGLPFSRLIKKNGQALSAREAREANQLDQKTRDEFVKKKSVQRVDRLQTFLNQELFSRYSLRTVRRETIAGRPAYAIMFQPKAADTAGDSLLDRVLNQMSGTIWVDEADFEIARVTMVLGKRVTLWKGMLGVLERFQMTLDRVPGAGGIWYNRTGWVLVEGRKLLGTMKFKAREEARDFGPAPQAPKPDLPPR